MAKQVSIYATLEPDSVAPFQFFRVFRGKAHDIPEERLMFAVLNDAVECLAKYREGKGRRDCRLFREARDWVMNEESEEVYSFENICDTLKIDPSYLRAGLLRWLGDAPATIQRLKVWRTPLRYQNRVLDFQIAS